MAKNWHQRTTVTHTHTPFFLNEPPSLEQMGWWDVVVLPHSASKLKPDDLIGVKDEKYGEEGGEGQDGGDKGEERSGGVHSNGRKWKEEGH